MERHTIQTHAYFKCEDEVLTSLRRKWQSHVNQRETKGERRTFKEREQSEK